MPTPFNNIAIAKAAERLPMLRKMPLARILILAEVGMLAKDHFERLSPSERRRLVVLVKDAKGRPSNLSARNRRELEALVAKIEPKRFATTAAEKFSPVPLRRKPSGS